MAASHTSAAGETERSPARPRNSRRAAVGDGPSTDDLAARVARLFFEQQVTKVEISTRLGISRFRVARLLDRALADGIVRIEFRDRPAQERGLASAIEARFGLDRCVVAAASADGADAAARLCADLVDGLLADGDTIGIAWGSTIARVVGYMPARPACRIDVVQLAGNSAAMDLGTAPGDLTRALAQRVGGRALALHAPTFVESPSLRAALAREPDVAAAIDRFDTLSMALIGIGAITVAKPRVGDAARADSAVPGRAAAGSLTSAASDAHSSLVRSGALRPAYVARLAAAGAVGDLLVHPFDAMGRFVAPELAARAMAISVDQLRRVRVIAVAAGAAKVSAIAGALRTGVVRTLVTDAETSLRLLGEAGA